MKRFNSLIFIALFAITLTNLHAQYRGQPEMSGVGLPFFELLLHNQFTEDVHHNRLLVIAQFLYDDLTFVKSDTVGYEAEFEFIIAVYDQNEQIVVSRTISKTFNVKNFDDTNSRDKKYTFKEDLLLKSGEYKVLVKSVDLTTNKSAQRKIDLKLPDYSEKTIDISGILLLHEVYLDSTGKINGYLPTFGNNFTAREGFFYIYFDLFTAGISEPANIRYIMRTKKQKIAVDTSMTINPDKKVTSHLLRIDRERLRKNRYELEIVAEHKGQTDSKKKVFSFYWSDVPETTEDIDLALRQMVYILDADSAKAYKDASLDEKQAFFKRFWKKRDPDPATAKNELKNEYFNRINYANQHFSAFSQDGWLTDRGRILIKFGFPDDIERHPFEMGTRPYEVWRYYSLRKVFLFEDRTGFGDYRLHPNYMDVEFQ